jgi:ATP-binding cassette subfamily C protein
LAFRIYVYYSNKASDFGKNLSEITSNIGNWTSSIFNNLKYIRTISKDRLARDESKALFKKFSKSYSNAMVASYKSKLITEILTILFIFISIIYILFRKSNASNLILSLSLFIRMAPKVYNAQSRLLDSIAMISWPKLYYEKISWAKKYSEDLKNNQKNKFIFDGKVELNSIYFHYPNSDYLFKNLSLQINNYDSIGIMGDSGAGKSTLLDLLTGIVRPNKGDIFISGITMNNINISCWREQIGIVMQDNFFKNDTIAANISLGEKYIDEHKIRKALIKANAWEFVKKLPNGIYEIIYDRGMRFSGGQRQKLALARAIYSNPKILILDEPSTGLDEKSEREFITSIKKLLGKMIIIIISHKKDVVGICERVFIVQNMNLKKVDV